MKITLLCHYFAPEPGAPQARLLETARRWVERGHEVTVLTGFPNHPGGILSERDRGRLFRADRIDGIRVLRSFMYATPNRGFLRKILGHLSFMVTAFAVGGLRARRPDVLVVSSPTFFSVLSAWLLALRWRRPFVFEVRDLWPAIFVELGVLRNRLVLGILTALEMFLYRSAAHVVTVTDGFKRDIVDRGISEHSVTTITNGVDLARYAQHLAKRPAASRFRVLYLGAHGISHALHRILDVAERWRDDPDAEFVFVGSGAEKPGLVRRARDSGLKNVSFHDPVKKDEVPGWYASADVCLVPLRNVPLFRTFIPSKMFEIMASRVPVVASVAGEAEEILSQSGGAVVVSPEDVDGIDRALRELRDDPDRRKAMGEAGHRFVSRNYDRALLADRYLELLEKVGGEG